MFIKPISYAVIATLTAVAAVVTIWSCLQLIQSFQSKNWPTATGEVIKSDVVSELEHSRAGSTPYTTVNFAFQYKLGDVEYTAHRASFGPSDAIAGLNRGIWGSNALTKAYPEGSSVTVHYDPKDPSNSVLNAAPTASLFYFLGFGLFIVLCAGEYFLEKANLIKHGNNSIYIREMIRIYGLIIYVLWGLGLLLVDGPLRDLIPALSRFSSP